MKPSFLSRGISLANGRRKPAGIGWWILYQPAYAGRSPTAPRLSRKLNVEGFIETVRPVGQANRGSEDDHLRRREFLRQRGHNLGIGLPLPRPLLGEAQNQFLQIAVDAALLVVAERFHLRLRETDLASGSAVIVLAVFTLIHLRRLQIGQFAQFGIEIALDRLIQGEGRL